MHEHWKWQKPLNCSVGRAIKILSSATLLLLLGTGGGCSLDVKSATDTKTDSGTRMSRVNMADEDTIILLKRIDKAGSAHTVYPHLADYADTNNNGIVDPADTGFFNPGSTIKVAIALAALDRIEQRGLSLQAEYKTRKMPAWIKVAKDIERMVVISDNEATNRIILWLGFDGLRDALARNDLEKMDINRLMLDRGTLIPGPVYDIRYKDKLMNDGPHQASKQPRCLETSYKVGNCATAHSLVSSMLKVVTSSARSSQHEDPAVSIGSSKYSSWLQETLAKRPNELGYKYEANYCRFIDGVKFADRNRQIRRLLSKCGVAPFTNTYSDLSYIEMNDGQRYVLLIARKYPFRPTDQAVVSEFQKLAVKVFNAISDTQ